MILKPFRVQTEDGKEFVVKYEGAEMATDIEALIKRLRKYTGTGFIVEDASEAAAALRSQAERIQALEADRDSWRDQASQRVEDWKREHDRVLALEAKCALLAASLAQADRGMEAYRELLRRSHELTCYVAAPFCSRKERHRDSDGNVYYIQPTTEDWWDVLREDIEALQPDLKAAIADQVGSKEES